MNSIMRFQNKERKVQTHPMGYYMKKGVLSKIEDNLFYLVPFLLLLLPTTNNSSQLPKYDVIEFLL